ncbi:putative glyoxalase superfamily protein PhnB [Amycolatopsis bartoniae]|uniref:Glyoxalase n=1 Tax=Amycolatopsis bartoniae TaxID=941986 RepID=A0A8H9MAL8_9PSEU|nr:VOC family protein [Amycolatopsis bartoniae]MBB2933305.1 putative glyoxalase superfamily protein PhnB [Amycolatopsis bartoniae]TVT08086.1 glyoxalase [Amycolatopsis bartoniae]GHF58559.1 glyoxalase [Amycolatopsis bartoniae]
MTDPFDALREPSRPADPDPRFAAELRQKLQLAILNGGEMTTTEAPARAELHSLTPYLAVSDARRALDFYVEVFGATRRGDPIVMSDGRIGHAELAVGDSVLMLAEESEDVGHVAAPGGASVRIEVPDVEGAVRRAVARGAELLRPVADTGHGLSGAVRDPFGQRWLVAQAPPRTSAGKAPRHGEAGYFTFQVPDDEAAKEFYGGVLGWQFSPGHVEHGWGIEGNGLFGGLWGGPGRQVGWKVMYAVDDLDAALARVRELGGQAGDVERQPYGLSAECVDNQGIEFWLWQP